MNKTIEWVGRDFERGTGKRTIVVGGGVSLRRGVTVADEIGRCNDRDRETIAGQRWARKTFVLDRVAGETAVLCPYLDCDTAGATLSIEVNGHVVTHVWEEERPYWTDRWTPVEVPADWLRVGENEVVFRAEDDATWSLLIEASRQPDRSSVSEDGGATWRSEDIGWNDGCDGEYMVRLWVDAYPARAMFASEVIDLCEDPASGVAFSGEPEARFAFDVGQPEGTSVRAVVRSGNTPAYDPGTWSAWSEADGLTVNDRFAQWAVEMTSVDGARSPLLRAVTAEVGADGKTAFRVVERSQGPIRRSAYRFAHASHDEPRAERLRERWQMDDVVRGSTSEWEAYLRLRQWVRDQWEDGWDMGEIDFCPPWDAMLILELTKRKLSLGMCTHYATVMSQCCAALGLTARTQIMRSHCINEVWSSDHEKWVAMDVGGDNDDETKFVYHFERDGVPLSAVECHAAWVNDDYGDVEISPAPPAATGDRYAVEKRLQLFERFMISLRNDELRSLEPGEPEHGKGSYHYDGYLFWEDEKTEPLPWFSHHTRRADDLYWSVNETYLHLQDIGNGTLSVLPESPTPNLAGFERSFDGNAWSRIKAPFAWSPASDGTRLHVRSLNGHGRPGVMSTAEVRAGG